MAKLKIKMDEANEDWLQRMRKDKPKSKATPKKDEKKASLRRRLIRLAYRKPQLRQHILPLLKGK